MNGSPSLAPSPYKSRVSSSISSGGVGRQRVSARKGRYSEWPVMMAGFGVKCDGQATLAQSCIVCWDGPIEQECSASFRPLSTGGSAAGSGVRECSSR